MVSEYALSEVRRRSPDEAEPAAYQSDATGNGPEKQKANL
ncbi:Uncharacterized protein pbN1_03330 [Aromatoleum bremense]|nr:Uncharacterized protein pbN1_03330 [Aromatoleum bremense]